MSSNIDYAAVTVPEDKHPTEYSYSERRSEVLQLIEEAGHPRALNQSELGERYGVSQQQISKDFDRLAEYVEQHLGEGHTFVMASVFHGAMLNLVEDGEYYRAAKVARWWSDWLESNSATSSETNSNKYDDFSSDGLDDEQIAAWDSVTRDSGPSELDVEQPR